MVKYIAISILVLSLLLIGCKPETDTDTKSAQENTSSEPSIVIAEDTTGNSQDKIKLDLEPEAKTVVAETEVVETPIITVTVPEEKPAEKISEDTAQISKPEITEADHTLEISEKPKPAAAADKVAAVSDTPKKETPKKDDKQSCPSLADMEFFKSCDFVFKNFVDTNGRVNYIRLRRKKIELLNAVRELGNVPTEMRLSWSENDEKAFLLNAHNILMLKLIIDNYPIKPNRWASIFYPVNSIKQLPGAREKNFYRVAGFRYTLDELEEELLKTSNDPRYCFALSNATVSGGILRNEAYHPGKLDKQLDEQARKYLADPKNLSINSRQKKVYLSSIFKLKNFKNSFLKSRFATIKRFREKDPETKAFMNFIFLNIDKKKAKEIESKNYDIKFETYNWLLNEQSD